MTSAGGRMNNSDLIAIVDGFPPDAAVNNKTGSVMIFPPPMSNVSRYWLHETRKANKVATTKLGVIIRSVILKKICAGLAPNANA